MTPTKSTTETTDLVCLAHDRYWPCKKLKVGDREHEWADYTFTSGYMERKF